MLLALAMLLAFRTNTDAHLRGVQLFRQHDYNGALAALQEAIKQEQPQSEE